MSNALRDPNPLFGISQRVPPTNLQAEQALLGALLSNNKAYARVADFLRAEHFADPGHAKIYAAIQKRLERGEIADVVTLRRDFENSSELEDVGGAAYLAQLLTATVGIINAGEYGRVIYDCWLRRQLIDAGETIVNLAFSPSFEEGSDATAIATSMASKLLELADPCQAQPAASLKSTLVDVITAAELAASGHRPKVIPSGLPGLDRILGGFQASQLIVVGGRPSMGKSVLAMVFALAAARHQHNGESAGAALVFSMEMSAAEWGERILANVAGISGTAIRDGALHQREWDNLVGAQREIEDLPIIIDDRASLTLDQIRVRARMVAARQKLAIIIIDYLGLLRVAPEISRHGPTAVIEHLSQGLKRLAKELQVPVIALAQLNRELERREDKRPMLSDLRQSGAIEQDADVVLLLYRDEYYLERNEPKPNPTELDSEFADRLNAWKLSLESVRGKLEILIAKHRRGPTGTIYARFDGATSRIWQEVDEHE
jgi:replicative DNA helicase